MILFLLLMFVRLSSPRTTLRYPPRRVESFPSCVEIASISPLPYSVLEFHKEDKLTYISLTLTFSKAVFLSEQNNNRAYFTSSPRGLNVGSKGVRTFTQAGVITMNDTSGIKWDIKFKLYLTVHRFFMKTFYLLIDGGLFYSYEYITSTFVHPIFVPLSIFGPFYLNNMERLYRGRLPVQPLVRSPYCRQEPIRDLPEPIGGTTTVDKFISVEIPERGHKMAKGSSTLNLLALVNVTEGKTSIRLPQTVTVQVEGIEHDVQLPPWNLTFDIPLTRTQALFKQKLIYDLSERIYLHNTPLPILYDKKNPLEIMEKLRLDGKEFAQPSVNIDFVTEKSKASKAPKEDDQKAPKKETWLGRLSTFVNSPGVKQQNSPGVKQQKKKKTKKPPAPETVMKERLIEVYDANTNVKLLEFEKRDETWIEKSQTGPVYDSKTDIPSPKRKVNRKFQFLKKNLKRCPVNSPRNLGRLGRLYHTVEYSRLYQMIVLDDPKKWVLRRTNGKMEKDPPMHVSSINSKGKETDLSGVVQFGWNNTGISSRIVKGLSQDYVCIQAIPTDDFINSFSMEEMCIFVPKNIAENSACGGLKLFENISGIINSPGFCKQKIGTCIGEPFSSPKRFPVIPPFGLPELAGWTMIEKSLDEFEKLPFSHYKTWRLKDSNSTQRVLYFYHSSPLHQLDIHHIPISGVKVLLPYVEFKKGKQFCSSVWRLDKSTTLTSSIPLTANINNSGQSTIMIDKESHAEVKFRISGALVSHKPTAHHTCKMNIAIRAAERFSNKIQVLPECTESITTYHGIFKDPCQLKAVQLPVIDMKYYTLPADQMEPLTRDKHVNDHASLPNERKFLLVKAITIFLGISGSQHELIGNLKQLHVFCGRQDVLITRSYGEFLVYQATAGLTDNGKHKPSLIFSADEIGSNSVFFFMPKRAPDSVEDPVYTDCWAELWANRPHPLCDQPTLLSYMAIPLRDYDQAVFEGEETHLSVVYGTISDGVQTVLVSCIVLSVILCVCGSIVHGILLLLRKRLPQTSTLKKYQKDLENIKKSDTEYWENPQMYLTSGPHGPFYKLHTFRATCPLDTSDIKTIKIAGTLRYENKTLQVLFGHVKKVYLDKQLKHIWIQASSGMYQLIPAQVSPEYREEYTRLMKRHKVKMKPSDYEEQSLLSSEEQQLPPLSHDDQHQTLS